jgi:peptidoglycan/LPS O-acetylase OafA/YrhL
VASQLGEGVNVRLRSLLGDRLANSSGYRPEIQALRAAAVMMVVVYHLWPNRLVGGYTGVDVFFVISGFLITSHLWSSSVRSRLSLSTFYSRRIRRLAPASVFVLIMVVAATAIFVPYGQWSAFGTEITGSALFVENWVLAHNSVDYLAATNVPSPVQHFWSLSVEEQFYLVWPLIILITALILKNGGTRTRARVTFGVLSLLFLGSLAFSIRYSHTHPAPAYFVTPTRVWQFAAGGMLALAQPAGFIGQRPRSGAMKRFAALASWFGFAAIMGTAFLLDAHTIEYPSGWGLFPVVPTLIVIAAGTNKGVALSPRWIYDLAPIQFLGTISYPIYLWHWPLIVLTPFIIGHDLTNKTRIGIIVLAIVLSALTTLFIENPIRFSPRLSKRTMLTPVFALVIVLALVVAPTAELKSQANAKYAAAKTSTSYQIFHGDKCFGAKVMENQSACPSISGTPTAAMISAATTDKPQPFVDGCIDTLPKHDPAVCNYGDVSQPPTVLLWGDSHAAAWGGAFNIAGQFDKVHVIVGSRQGCPAVEAAPIATVYEAITSSRQGLCNARNQQMLDLVRTTPTIKTVVLASYSADYIYGADPTSPDYYAGTTDLIRDLHAAGVTVLLLGDVPVTGPDSSHRVDIPDCLSKHMSDPNACNNPRQWALATTALRDAITASPVASDVTVIDTSSEFCDATQCYAMIGGIPVFCDASHISDSYSESLAPWVLDHVLKLKASGR